MTYIEILSYIERIGAAHHDINTVYIGDYEKIYDLIAQPDRFELPALWVETPEISFVGSADSISDSWDVSVVVLYPGSTVNNSIEHKYHTELAFRTARSIALRIANDVDERLVNFNLVGKTLSPIDPYSGDRLCGWRIDLALTARTDAPCYLASDWDEAYDIHTDFYMDISKSGDDYTTTTSPMPGWTLAYRYTLDGGSTWTVMTADFTVTAPSTIYIECTATKDSRLRHCSGSRVGRSIPFIYNPYL